MNSTGLAIRPALVALRNCASTALVRAGQPVCHMPVIWGDAPLPAQRCECECPNGGQGEGWVRLVRATQSPLGTSRSGGRNRTPPPGCEVMMWEAAVEIGVWRCALTLDETTGEPPDDEAYDRHTRQMMVDARALTSAWGCCEWLEERDITGQTDNVYPLGPAGGCVGVAVTGRLILPGCDPCPRTT